MSNPPLSFQHIRKANEELMPKSGFWANAPAIIWAFNQSGLSPEQKLHLVALARYCDKDNGRCIPYQKTIARDVGVSVPTIQRSQAHLAGRGLIFLAGRLITGARLSAGVIYVLFQQSAIHAAISEGYDPANPKPSRREQKGIATHQDDASYTHQFDASKTHQQCGFTDASLVTCQEQTDLKIYSLKSLTPVTGSALDAGRGLGEGIDGESARTGQAKPVFVEIHSPQWDAWCAFRGDAPATISRKIFGEVRSGYMFASQWPPGFDDHAEVAP